MTKRKQPEETFWSPEPILAVRKWLICLVPNVPGGGYAVKNCFLEGSYGQVWNESTLRAKCWRCNNVPGRIVPGWDCYCGIYAYKRVDHFDSYPHFYKSVFGVVSLSGRIIEHSKGYRAEQVAMKTLMWFPHTVLPAPFYYGNAPATDPDWLTAFGVPVRRLDERAWRKSLRQTVAEEMARLAVDGMKGEVSRGVLG